MTDAAALSGPIDDDEVLALRESARRASELLKLLANEQRLLILCKLLEGECTVGTLAVHVGLAQSAMSQHLARLRDSGIVETRREAQSIHYRIADETTMRVLRTLCEIYAPGH